MDYHDELPYGFGKGVGVEYDPPSEAEVIEQANRKIMRTLEQTINAGICERIRSTRDLQTTKSPTSNQFLDSLTLFDCLILRAREWRYLVEPVKYAVMAEAMENHYGQLHAITAQFSPDIERKLLNAKIAPSTFLKQRMHRSFGESAPRLGAFEYGGHGKEKALHVHFLLPQRDFSDWKSLRERLVTVFGDRKSSRQFDCKPAIHSAAHGSNFFGIELTGPAGWLLYGLKGVIATQKRLNITPRLATKKPLPVVLSRAQMAMHDSGKALPMSHYDLTGVAFYSADVGKLGQESW
jgi:hypothetical protein